MRNYFFLFVFIYSIHLVLTNQCDVCELNGYFIPSNGYQCFITVTNQTICTCPDALLSTFNRPCRVCQRAQICGSSNNLCSEESTYFNSSNRTSYFACFCASGLFLIGEKCPQDILPTTFSTPLTVQTTSTFNPTITNNSPTPNTPIPVTSNTPSTMTSNTPLLTTTSVRDTTPLSSAVSTSTTQRTSESTVTRITITVTPPTTETATTATSPTTATLSTTGTSARPCECRSTGSHLPIELYLLALGNILYFLKK